MVRIVLVGAGSVVFTRNLVGDVLSCPSLRGAELVLHDIDPERLRVAERMTEAVAAALGARPAIRGSLDRRAALCGADVVVNMVQVGGADATRVDFDVPRRYGVRYTIADTIGAGAVFRALRTIPVAVALAEDVAELCRNALLLNYTNPLPIIVRAVATATGVRVVGLCHSVFHTVERLAGYLGVPYRELRAISAGINHMAFLLRLEHDGRDVYPALASFVAAGGVPDDDRVRAHLYRRLGYYPTESSEHHAEYSSWYIGKRDVEGDAVERFNVPLDEYLRRVSANLGTFEATREQVDAGRPFDVTPSGEYASTIIDSLVTGVPSEIVASVPNRGQLIPNLDAGACVEVPCLVNGLGIHPVAMGPLPLQLAAYLRQAIDGQALTVKAALEHDRDAVFHAVMTDPVVQATLTLDDAWRMTEDLIAAEAAWLPEWLGGRARFA